MNRIMLIGLVFALAGCGAREPSAKEVDKQFRTSFLGAFGCPVRECTVVKQARGSFSIDYAYWQCPRCHTDIKFSDHPCTGHSPQPRRSHATASVDGKGQLRFYLASGREFDSWGVKQ